MSLGDFSREVGLVCRACGNDRFEYDDSVGDLADASDVTKLTCSHCGLETTKGELMEDNSEAIAAVVDEIVEDVASAMQGDFEKAFAKALG